MSLVELEGLIPSEILWDLYLTWKMHPYGSLLEAWEMAYSTGEMPKRVKGLSKQLERVVRALGDT